MPAKQPAKITALFAAASKERPVRVELLLSRQHASNLNVSPPVVFAEEDHVPEPRQHTEHRNAIESVLRHIPGFRGYLEKEYRRDSDALARTFLADRLQQAKRALDTVSSQLADAGRLDLLTQYDHLRAKIDKVIARIKGAFQGYSGIFDLVKVDEGRLDKVYEHDMLLVEQVEDFLESVKRLSGLPASGPSQTTASPPPAMAAGVLTPAAEANPAAPGAGNTAGPPDPVAYLPRLNEILDAIEAQCDQRADLLKGLD